MCIWLTAFVFITCLEQYELRDSCTNWRLKIHREYEESGEALAFTSFVNSFAASVSPEMFPYSNLQLQLEGIAEQHNLYKTSDGETNKTIQNLLQEPEAQKIIKECKKFNSKTKCNKHSLYRSADGTCNNLKHPLWGSGDYTMARMLPAAYDGINGFRKSVAGEDLPMFRYISLKLKETTNPSQLVSAFFTFYGQAIVHDITSIPGIISHINCCDNNQINHTICIAIHNKPNDYFYGQYNVTCQQILRTAPYPTCGFNKRIQANKITSFLDLSLIYGSDKKTEKDVRGNFGLLKTQGSSRGRLLPKAESKDALFCPINGTEWCFRSGDERSNQHLQLTNMYTMFVRLHNYVRDHLHRMNPHWNWNKLYLESRRLTSALLQQMVYSEYLPLLVGSENMEKYNLSVDKGSRYDDEQSPNSLLEFNTASFRLHSMVPKQTSKYHRDITFDISYSFYCPLHSGQLNSYIGGSCEIPSEKNDHFLKDSVQGYLYRPPRATYGDDLASINIARGRDHGLPVYIDMVKKCTNGKIIIKKFSDLETKGLMTEENKQLLEGTYKDVRDIDLWIGLILEREIDDAVTGPTAACISSTQFKRMKYGDSFFFTHSNGRYPFTKDQLRTIRKYSLSRFLCDTIGQHRVRKYPLKIPSKTNPLIYCNNHSSMDLSAWKEKK